MLADRGIDAPAALWDGPGRRWLAQVELPTVERQVVEDVCGLLDAIELPIARLERQIKQLAKPDPRVEALQRQYGVGLLTAMTLVSEIGDISRFPDARKLCAWAGLTPKFRNSDMTVHHDQITKQGPVAVRFVLVEAAQMAKLRPPFDEVYDSIRRRRGRQIATVAIARRLLAQSFHILKEVDKIATGEADRCAG